MRVRELIEELWKFDKEWDIYFADEAGTLEVLSIYEREEDETVWIDVG